MLEIADYESAGKLEKFIDLRWRINDDEPKMVNKNFEYPKNENFPWNSLLGELFESLITNPRSHLKNALTQDSGFKMADQDGDQKFWKS